MNCNKWYCECGEMNYIGIAENCVFCRKEKTKPEAPQFDIGSGDITVYSISSSLFDKTHVGLIHLVNKKDYDTLKAERDFAETNEAKRSVECAELRGENKALREEIEALRIGLYESSLDASEFSVATTKANEIAQKRIK